MLGYTYDVVSGTLHPAPARVKPKVGHWRVTPGGKHKMAPLKRADIAGAQMPKPFQPHTQDLVPLPALSVRQRVRAAVAAGLIAPQDAPQWARSV